jgi:hypothetical protein
MVDNYTCRNAECALYEKLIGVMRTKMSKKDGKTRVCPLCEKKVFVVKTFPVSGARVSRRNGHR